MSGDRRRARRVLVAAAASACSLLFLPGFVTPVAAAWTDREMVSAPVRLTSGDCTETGLYTASAASALLAGTVQGVRIGSGSATAGAAAGPRTAAGTATATLRTADAGATPVVGGVELPLVLAAGGSWTQSASTSGTGASSASVGGASPLGSIGVSTLLQRSPSAVSLLPGLSGVALTVGVPSAAASLDGCAAGWGATDALSRGSDLSTLTLGLHDTAVDASLDALRSHGLAAGTALTGKAASAGTPLAQAAATALTAALVQALGTSLLTVGGGAGTATVTPAVGGIAGTVQGARTDSSSTLDSGTGAVTLDLLASGAGPDADLVTASTTAAGATATVRILRAQAADVAGAVRTARENAPVAVTATATVASGATPLATVAMSASGTAADWIAGRATIRPVVVTTLSTLVAPPSGLVGAVGSALAASTTIPDAVSSAYLVPARAIAPDTALTADADAATTDLRAHLAALPAVLTATAGQRATDAASSWTGSLAPGVSTRTALRVRVADAAGTRADLFVGNVAVGPDRPVS